MREEAPALGDISGDFNFEQTPRPPQLLHAEPAAGPASKAPGEQQPPALETAPARDVAAAGATVAGTVNPDGAEVTDCHFEYGLTTTYGGSAPCNGAPGSGSSPVEELAVLEGLSPITTYHFRIGASNEGGTAAGPDLTFTTLPLAPTIEVTPAGNVTRTSATLNGTVNPNGSEVTECLFEYGTSTAYEASVPCAALPGAGRTPVTVSAPVSALVASTTYHYRILATNAGGTTHSSDGAFRTLAPLPAVTGLSPVAGLTEGGTSVTITGTDLLEASAVRFGASEATSFSVESPTVIHATAPAGKGTVDVTVTTPAGTSTTGEADRFTYVKPGTAPAVKTIEPAEGPAAGGTAVTITGARFTGVTAVTFGSTPASSYTVPSAQQILAVTPAAEPGTVAVTVTTPNGTSTVTKKTVFTFNAPPMQLRGRQTSQLVQGLQP